MSEVQSSNFELFNHQLNQSSQNYNTAPIALNHIIKPEPENTTAQVELTPPVYPVVSRIKLPKILIPKATSDVQMNTKNDTEKFIVANSRKIENPAESGMARIAVLNALRTVVPSRGVFKIGNFKINLVIYDFYYCGAELRMIILVLSTLELFDAFAFKEDIMHMLKGCADIIDQGNTQNVSACNQYSSFNFYFIKLQQINKFQSLSKVICSAAKSIKFNKSLFNWMTDATRPFFQSGKITNIPKTWKPFPQQLVNLLSTTAFLPYIANKCDAKDSTGTECACDLAHSVHSQQSPYTKWSAEKLVEFLPNITHWKIKAFIRPCATVLAQLKYTSQTISALPKQPSSLISIDCFKKPEPLIGKFSYDQRGRRIRCQATKSCKNAVWCYFVNCCKPSEPVLCVYHAERKLQKRKDIKMELCPVHHQSGKIAKII
jgi:hypothetical protein